MNRYQVLIDTKRDPIYVEADTVEAFEHSSGVLKLTFKKDNAEVARFVTAISWSIVPEFEGQNEESIDSDSF